MILGKRHKLHWTWYNEIKCKVGSFSTTSEVQYNQRNKFVGSMFSDSTRFTLAGSWIIKLLNFWYGRNSFQYNVQTRYTTSPASYMMGGGGGISLKVKWAEYKAIHYTEITRALYPYPAYIFIAGCLNEENMLPCTIWFTKYHCRWKYLTNNME
jgi:hypothetical protein